jgi:hypothetical protein
MGHGVRDETPRPQAGRLASRRARRWATAAGGCLIITLVAAGGVAASVAGWSMQSIPAPAGASDTGLFGVSCSSTSACVAVGSSVGRNGGSFPLAEHWDGSTWVVRPTPRPAGAHKAMLTSISCVSPNWCVAAGWYAAHRHEYSIVEHWNGVSWLLQGAPRPRAAVDSELDGVSCSSPSACMAVGMFGNRGGDTRALIDRWTGAGWQVERPARPVLGTGLLGVSCVSPAACTAVGDRYGDVALIERWTGQAWTLVPPNDELRYENSALGSVSCVSSRDCTAVGAVGNSAGTFALVERVRGGRSSIQYEGGDSGELYGVSCLLSICTAVGDDTAGTPIVQDWARSTPTLHSFPAPDGVSGTFTSVDCVASSSCVTVGYMSKRHAHAVALIRGPVYGGNG